jgi:hypothetical protein
MTSRTTAALVALLAALAASSTACGVDRSTAGPADPVPTSWKKLTPKSAQRQDALLRRIGTVRSDVPGMTISAAPAGLGLEMPTLQMCGYRFPSERLRLARRQLSIVTPGVEDVEYSSEVVAYRRPADAAAALAELKDSIAVCPQGEVTRSGVPGVGPIRTDRLEFAVNPPGLAVRPSLWTSSTTEIEGGRLLYGVAYYQVHGAILDGSYLITLEPATPDQLAELTRQARLTGARLIAERGTRTLV